MFIIQGLHKSAEIDVWNDGCQMEGGQDSFIDYTFKATSIDEVIEKARHFVGVENDAIERDSCEEKGRVDFARTENDNGEELTPAEVKQWKAGKLRAWYCIYTGYVQQVSAVSAS